MTVQKILHHQIILSKKNNTLLNLSQSLITVTKIACSCHKNRHIDQCRRTKAAGISSYSHSHLIFYKNIKNSHWIATYWRTKLDSYLSLCTKLSLIMSRNCVRVRGKRKWDTLQAVAQEMGQTFEKLELIKLKKKSSKEIVYRIWNILTSYTPDRGLLSRW